MQSTIMLKCPGSRTQLDAPAPRAALKSLEAAFGTERVRAFAAVDAAETCVFLDLERPQPDHAGFAAALTQALRSHAQASLKAMALNSVLSIPGASAAEPARFLYVVEITAAEANMPAVSAWYQEEHMPGLAAVPGCVHAQRFLTHGREPVSVACYDIADAGIRETAAWNAMRGTPWTNRVRPHFLNLTRNMYAPIPDFKLD